MATSADYDRYFQTTSSLEQNERRQRKSANNLGSPIKLAKILALEVNSSLDPDEDTVFVVASDGTISNVRIPTGQVSSVLRGPKAPLTSISSLSKRDSSSLPLWNIYAGCWDKSIWKFTVGQPGKPRSVPLDSPKNWSAHRDFVKCLVAAQTPSRIPILISGGADGDINFWSSDGTRLASLRPAYRGIESLVLDPYSAPDAPTVYASTSQREIFSFVIPDFVECVQPIVVVSEPIIAHQTSVYKLYFDNDGDLWTASADKTAKHLVRERGWAVDTTLEHPDFVRDVVVHDRYGWVITACRDEEVRVWNRSTGDLHHIFSGHFEEVTCLAILGDYVLSGSIDCTLRKWSLEPAELRQAVELAKKPLIEQEPEPEVELDMLTEEEEAELRAMMEDQEAESLEKMAMDEQ